MNVNGNEKTTSPGHPVTSEFENKLSSRGGIKQGGERGGSSTVRRLSGGETKSKKGEVMLRQG